MNEFVSQRDTEEQVRMGIKDLLKELRSITTVRHLNDYKGLRAGVDIMCWLYRGIHRCVGELIKGEETEAYIDYCMGMIYLLKQYEIIPYIVLDGRKPRAKREKNLERKHDRDENRTSACEALAEGNTELAQALYRKSITITSDMICKLILKMREGGIEFLVSPYEADAQLAYLSMNGMVDFVITEDSDAVVYGCSRILFKLNLDTHLGDEIVRRNMGNVKELSFTNWTDDQFKLFACLAGSDYQKKLPNMGVKRAHQFANNYKTYDGICRALRESRFAENATGEFFEGLKQAWLTFKHQLVYDDASRQCVYLTAVSEDNLDIDDVIHGEFIEQDILLKIVQGTIEPHTLSPYERVCASIYSPKLYSKDRFAVVNVNEQQLNFQSLKLNKDDCNCLISLSTDSKGNMPKKRHFPWGDCKFLSDPEMQEIVKKSRIAKYNQRR